MFPILLLALVFSYMELAYSADCENPFVKVGSKCLWKSYDGATYAETLRKCKSMGARMATPKTLEESKLLRNFLGTSTGHLWMGGHRSKPGVAEFIWFDGSPITYTDWQPKEPNFFTNPAPVCLLINGPSGWDDYLCHTKYGQICEKDIKAEDKTLQLGTKIKDLESKLSAQTTDIEKFEKDNKNLKDTTQQQANKIKDLESKLSAQTTETQKFEKDTKNLKDTTQQQANKIKDLESKLSAQTTETQKFEKDNKNLKDTTQQQANKIKDLETKLSTQSSDAQKCEKGIKKLKDASLQRATKIKDLEAELSNQSYKLVIVNKGAP